jgi:hypothetical protein
MENYMSIYQQTVDFIRNKYSIDLTQESPDYALSFGNSKLAKDGIASFNLIPIVHCPMAGACKAYCYATVGMQAFKNGVLKRARAFLATQQSDFVERMGVEVKKAIKKNTKAIRIHDSGDFYSFEYLAAWMAIASQCPGVQFYAYTKMIAFVKAAYKQGKVPVNFRLIQSLGGVADSRIDSSLPHSRIFNTVAELHAAGYADASESDGPAAFGNNPNVGLVIHGAKSKQFDAKTAMKISA